MSTDDVSLTGLRYFDRPQSVFSRSCYEAEHSLENIRMILLVVADICRRRALEKSGIVLVGAGESLSRLVTLSML